VRDGNNVYYPKGHPFIGRVFDLAAIKSQDLVKPNLNTCLHGSVFIWYIAELTPSERSRLRQIDLREGWIDSLRK